MCRATQSRFESYVLLQWTFLLMSVLNRVVEILCYNVMYTHFVIKAYIQ